MILVQPHAWVNAGGRCALKSAGTPALYREWRMKVISLFCDGTFIVKQQLVNLGTGLWKVATYSHCADWNHLTRSGSFEVSCVIARKSLK